MQSKKKWLIIQAGGLGTRLRPLTENRPKCLVPVGGETILSHAIKTFDDTNVIVIGDHLSDIIIEYVNIFFPQVKIVKAKNKGTCGGLFEALNLINKDDAIIFSWSDLFFEKQPNIDTSKTTIGLSRTFSCRYQYDDAQYSKRTDCTNGVAGFFVFPNKSFLIGVPKEGSFVGSFLKNTKFVFDNQLWLDDVHEIGTIDSLEKFESTRIKSRFFNEVIISQDKVIKKARNGNFSSLIENEIGWYKKIHELGSFSEIPKLLNENPFEIEKRQGKHPYEYPIYEKIEVMNRMADFFERMHTLCIENVNSEDMQQMYLTKVLDRVRKYSKLIRCYNQEKIIINGVVCDNPWIDEKNISKIAQLINANNFCLIHGDPTFSNTMWDSKTRTISIFDPRGQFGKSKLVGDPAYDWTKLYYSAVDEYDKTNTRTFFVQNTNENWNISNPNCNLDAEFWRICPFKKEQILLRLSTIWFSLVGYVENDIDAMNFAFLKGCLALGKIKENNEKIS